LVLLQVRLDGYCVVACSHLLEYRWLYRGAVTLGTEPAMLYTIAGACDGCTPQSSALTFSGMAVAIAAASAAARASVAASVPRRLLVPPPPPWRCLALVAGVRSVAGERAW
jgi:hypothetical protein